MKTLRNKNVSMRETERQKDREIQTPTERKIERDIKTKRKRETERQRD